MSGSTTTGKGAKKKPDVPGSEPSAPYGLRKTKDRTLLDMMDNTSGRSPSAAKRGPLSPHKQKVTDKIFVTPSMVTGSIAEPNGRPEETPIQPLLPLQTMLMSPDKANNEQDKQASPPQQALATTKSPGDIVTHETKPSIRDTITRLAGIISAMKDLCENADTPDNLAQLVQEAHIICVENNFVGNAQLISIIEKAKTCPDLSEKIKVCNMKWPNDAYGNTKFMPDSNETIVAPTTIVFTLRGKQDQILKSTISDQIPAIKKLSSDCPQLTTITCTEMIGDQIATTQNTHVLTLDDEGNDKLFIEQLTALREKLSTTEREITLKTTTGHPTALRKACVLVLPDLSCSILTDRWMRGKEHRIKTETVTVSSEVMTYADLLKGVKDNVKGEDIGVRILQARRNAKGELEMRVKGSAKTVTDVIKKTVPGARTNLKQRIKTMHIRDLEEEVTMEEITKGIRQALPHADCQNIVVKSIRPAFNNTCNATIQLPEYEASILHKRGHLQIGLVSARIRIRTETQRCPRCWEEGHGTRECKGPDMRDKCFQCKQPGHQKFQCPLARQHPTDQGSEKQNDGK